ncbi:MAG: YggT family protein [Chloroflexi bacterium]|nr:YggT family protein [Chloroflexota bacterium]MDA8188673.1 YggT family protein [Dehalococcoidales bacterium]
MIVVRNFVDVLFNVLILAILARAILSWFRLGPDNPLIQILYDITEPILSPLRRVIPPLGGMIDITPIIALFLLRFLQQMIMSGLY